MKTKKKQFLSLNKATIANLNGKEMLKAFGGVNTDINECPPTYYCAPVTDSDYKTCHYDNGETDAETCEPYTDYSQCWTKVNGCNN